MFSRALRLIAIWKGLTYFHCDVRVIFVNRGQILTPGLMKNPQAL